MIWEVRDFHINFKEKESINNNKYKLNIIGNMVIKTKVPIYRMEICQISIYTKVDDKEESILIVENTTINNLKNIYIQNDEKITYNISLHFSKLKNINNQFNISINIKSTLTNNYSFLEKVRINFENQTYKDYEIIEINKI